MAESNLRTAVLGASIVCGLISAATARDDSGAKQFFMEQFNRTAEMAAPHIRAFEGSATTLGRMARHFRGEARRQIASARRPDPARRLIANLSMPRRPLTVHAHSAPLLAEAGDQEGRVTSMYNDPTLRVGDAIMTERGLRVFQGSGSFPYRPENFTTVFVAEGLDSGLRRALIEADQAPVGHTIGRLAHL